MAQDNQPHKVTFFGRMHEALLFFSRSIRHPIRMSTPLASSRRLGETVTKELAGRPSSRVVELGSGTGRITASILDALGQDDVLLCVESDKTFCRHLGHRFNGRVQVVQGDAMELDEILADHEWEGPDVIVSSVPMVGQDASRLCQQVAKALPSHGLYLQVTNWPGVMRPFFQIEREYFFPLNMPPERLYCAVPKK